MARIISIVNQKGGTGKSACTANLAVGLAQKNMKVLIVDADPQSDVSAGFGYRDCDDSNETLTVLMDAVMKDEDIPSDCYIRHQAEGIDIICSNIGLAGTEVQLVNAMSREYVLKQILYGIKDQYDAVIIDCMPSLGMITINALAASDEVLIPVEASYLPIKGFGEIRKAAAALEQPAAFLISDEVVDHILRTGSGQKNTLFHITARLIEGLDDLKRKLMEKGVPEKEIAFIHDANTEAKKTELFGKVKSGQVRFLIGSTAKMGAGTNVQDRLIALHHLDIGWKPSDLEQREGRIIRQGNHNKKVHIFRYVTESTFDSYMWQLIENKQKFISQIMTSKAPVRSCEDVDEAALSYAEVKALATGNPAVKEKMALDVDVAKLKLLKANHMNNQYRLEDDIARNFPQQIAKLTEIIDSYKADIAHFSEYKITDPEQFSMEISGKVFTEKKEAGAALLAVCKEIKSVDAAMDIGSYQGFNMRIQFDSWSKEFILSVKHESVAKVRLGADALGNITRINNLLESYPEKLAEAEQRLETVQEQMTNAKEEVGKPFPKEEELNQKLERLSELNALLNMDEREDTETEQSESKEKEERPARGSIHEKLQIYKEKSQRESETGKETRKRDFGLE